MNVDVVLLCDGNITQGYGHIRRTLSLYEYIKKQGIAVAIQGLSSQANALLANNILNIKPLNNLHNCIVVIDIPYDATVLVECFKKQNNKVICLDSRSTTAPDLTLLTFKHNDFTPIGRYDVGLKFVIIRDEFHPLIQKKTRSTRNVLLALGGADVNNQTLPIAKKLQQWQFSVHLVLGPLAKQHKALMATGINIYHNPKNFPALMNNADWCIVNGGGCLFESLFLHKATLVIPQSPYEQNIATYLQTKQQLLGVGLSQLKAFSLQEIQQCEQQQHDIDGLGLLRITQYIQEFIHV